MIDGPRDHKLGFTRVLFRIVRSCRLLAIVSYQLSAQVALVVERDDSGIGHRTAAARCLGCKFPRRTRAGFVGQIGQIRQTDRPKTTPRDPRGDPLIQSETSEGVSETHSS